MFFSVLKFSKSRSFSHAYKSRTHYLILGIQLLHYSCQLHSIQPYSSDFQIPSRRMHSSRLHLAVSSVLIEIMNSSITLLLLLIPFASSIRDDVQCLRDFKSSVSDPDGHLATWSFSNFIEGFLCSFAGVSCWHPYENRVLSIALPSFSLSGPVPSALRLCSSVTTLDLSYNNLSGPIPPSLCEWLPYLVILDLSFNSLTGPIPPELFTCRFLNSLNISSNMLSGTIPYSLTWLQRLHTLDLSGNNLSGSVPATLSRFGASSFIANPSLCGYPFPDCREPVAVTKIAIINLAAGICGFLLSLTASYVVWRFRLLAKFYAPEMIVVDERVPPVKAVQGSTRQWSDDRLRPPSRNVLVRVSLFKEPMEEVMVADLMAATADFHPDNVVVAGCSDAGTSYKAVLWDGSALTVKRIRECPLSDQQFRRVMCTIGEVCHPNLVPLLGFCVAGLEDRLMIYKNMPNGALSSLLENWDEHLDWPTRLKIGIGAARGLAWLHHGFPAPLLHQNFSSSAVLLDEDYEPRITDFGLASLFSTTSSTFTKDDVYEFGVVLLELATDQIALAVESYIAGDGSSQKLADLVLRLSDAGRIHEAIDQYLRSRGYDDQIVEFLRVACRCVVARPEERPSMCEVYQSLKSIGGRHELSEQDDEFTLQGLIGRLKSS